MRNIGLACLFAFTAACTVASDPYGEAPRGEDPSRPADPSSPTPAVTDPAAPGNDPLAPAPKPGPGEAMVRVIHASADAPAVDVYPKGSDKPLVTNIAYGQTSGWLQLKPGTYELELRVAPSKPTDAIVYKTPALTIPEKANVSAIAAGLIGSNDADSNFRVLGLVENFDPTAAGKVRVRALHAGADAPSVDLDVGNDDPANPELGDLMRFADTGAGGIELPAATNLAVGIAKDKGRVTSFTTPKLPAGAQLLVIATGLLGKLGRERDGFSLLAIGPSGAVGFIKQDPIVYALHASPDAPRVDAFVGNAQIVDGLSFGQLAKPVQVPPGAYTVDFYGATAGDARPAGNPAASGQTGNLEAGQRYLAAATGFLGGNGANAFQLVGVREGFDMVEGKAQLRAIHASPDAPQVDIGLVTTNKIDPVIFNDLAFSRASAENGFGAPLAHLPVGVTPAGQSTSIVARFTVSSLTAPRAFVVAAGALAPKAGQQSFRLLVVDTKPTPWTVATVSPH